MLDICPDIIYEVFLFTFITRMDQTFMRNNSGGLLLQLQWTFA